MNLTYSPCHDETMTNPQEVLERIKENPPRRLRQLRIRVVNFLKLPHRSSRGHKESFRIDVQSEDDTTPKSISVFLHVRKSYSKANAIKRWLYDPLKTRVPELIIRAGDRVDDVVRKVADIIHLVISKVRRCIDHKRHKRKLRQTHRHIPCTA